MTDQPNRDQLTLDDLRAYQAGVLAGSARHRVERLLLENPFYADALAGLEALQQTGASLPAQTDQLRETLHRRVRESATKQRLWSLWLATAIAAILLVLCIAVYLIFFTKPVKPANRPSGPANRSVTAVTGAAAAGPESKARERVTGTISVPDNAGPVAHRRTEPGGAQSGILSGTGSA